MLMMDVRTAISKVLDRYSLADIVAITLRKMRRDKVAPSFRARVIELPPLLSGMLERDDDKPRRTYATRSARA